MQQRWRLAVVAAVAGAALDAGGGGGGGWRLREGNGGGGGRSRARCAIGGGGGDGLRQAKMAAGGGGGGANAGFPTFGCSTGESSLSAFSCSSPTHCVMQPLVAVAVCSAARKGRGLVWRGEFLATVGSDGAAALLAARPADGSGTRWVGDDLGARDRRL